MTVVYSYVLLLSPTLHDEQQPREGKQEKIFQLYNVSLAKIELDWFF